MSDPNSSDKAPISIRTPKADPEQPLFNEDGFANASREGLFKLFEGDPEALRKLDSIFQLEDGEETMPISSRPGEPAEE